MHFIARLRSKDTKILFMIDTAVNNIMKVFCRKESPDQDFKTVQGEVYCRYPYGLNGA